MENSILKGRILVKMEYLIARSCPKQKVSKNYETLHVAILKKYYNATDVSIDYHRRRVKMDIVMDDKDYDPKTVNLCMPTLYVNLRYRNLCNFLKSCIDYDNKSLVFYSSLLSSYINKNLPLMMA